MSHLSIVSPEESVAERRRHLTDVRRVVVKVGTRNVARPDGTPNEDGIESWAHQIARLRRQGKQVLLVASGAVYLGQRALGREADGALRQRQAAAAVGQPLLMRYWRRALMEFQLVTAQILITSEDIADRQRAIHLRNTVSALLEAGAIPVFNENDSVSVAGVTAMDNDRLAAGLAGLIGADLLILLTDQQGLFTAHPDRDAAATLIGLVRSDEVDAMRFVEDGEQPESRGGMMAKVEAARIAVTCGIPCAVASGHDPLVICRLLEGEPIGTFFVPGERLSSRRSWIASGQKPVGQLVVDQGAYDALLRPGGSSLLAVGVVDVRGEFAPGDLVAILDSSGREIARGLVNYASDEANRIKGAHSDEIAGILGHSGHETIIHRDNLVITPSP
jgi:glutamate 5-kinase